MSPQRRSGLGTNQEAIRRHNLGTVLRHVHSTGEMSRASLTSLDKLIAVAESRVPGLVHARYRVGPDDPGVILFTSGTEGQPKGVVLTGANLASNALQIGAHAHGALVLFDGTQAVVHRRVDVQAIGADFYTWTGHKLYGPTGIGVLWARKALLEAMPPFLGGGDMIGSVSFERSTWAEVPHKFEAGTPPILEAVGLTAAIEYVEAIGFDAIAAHEAALTDHALARLGAVPGLRVLGTAQDRGSVFSFTLAGAHAHDVATLLDRQGIAVRAGNHCAEPLMRRLGVDSTARASCGLYTTLDEIDQLADTLDRVREFFA